MRNIVGSSTVGFRNVCTFASLQLEFERKTYLYLGKEQIHDAIGNDGLLMNDPNSRRDRQGLCVTPLFLAGRVRCTNGADPYHYKDISISNFLLHIWSVKTKGLKQEKRHTIRYSIRLSVKRNIFNWVNTHLRDIEHLVDVINIIVNSEISAPAPALSPSSGR